MKKGESSSGPVAIVALIIIVLVIVGILVVAEDGWVFVDNNDDENVNINVEDRNPDTVTEKETIREKETVVIDSSNEDGGSAGNGENSNTNSSN